MEYKVLFTVFAAVFVAELGDKTQLATMLFAADKEVSKVTVFVGASMALIVASGIGVLAGSAISQYLSPKHLNYIAGIGFVGIGIAAIEQRLDQLEVPIAELVPGKMALRARS